MPLTPLVFNDKNFQDIRDRTPAGFPSMNAADFDEAFNKIIDFVNDSIIANLNQLLSATIPGSTSMADINKFRRNVGDGTTDWSFIGNDAFADFSLEFSKLSKCTPCSILATGADKIFKEVTTNQSNLTLISRANNLPKWGKLENINIEDGQITGIKIALRSLNNINFQAGLLTTQLIDNSVTGSKVQNRTIPGSKFDNTQPIDADVLGNLTNQLLGRNNTDIPLWGNTLPDGFIANVNYFNDSRIIYYYHLKPDFKIPNTNPIKWGGENVADGAIDNYQIANNGLDGKRLNMPTGSGTYTLVRDINDLIGDGEITAAHLPASYRTALGL